MKNPIILLLAALLFHVADAKQAVLNARVERINSFLDETSNQKKRFEVKDVQRVLMKYKQSKSLGGTFNDDYAIFMTSNRVCEFVKNWGEIKEGDTTNRIEKLLGTPSCRFVRSRNENDFSCGVCLRYYLAKRDILYDNDLRDTSISLYFNKNGMLEFVFLSMNLEDDLRCVF